MREDFIHESYNSSEAVCVRFNRLMQNLLQGKLDRNAFNRWEVDLLVDIESCAMRPSEKRRTLMRYQKAVTKQLEHGASQPFRLAEYLRRNGLARKQCKRAS
jgi:hypothetical protein